MFLFAADGTSGIPTPLRHGTVRFTSGFVWARAQVGQLLLLPLLMLLPPPRHPSCSVTPPCNIAGCKFAQIGSDSRRNFDAGPLPLSVPRLVKSLFVPISAAPTDYRRNPLYALDFSAIEV